MWKAMHYPLETSSIQLILRILAAIVGCSSSEEKEERAKTYMSFMHGLTSQDTLVHKLLGPKFIQQVEDLRQVAAQFFTDPAVSWFMTPEGFTALFALIGRNGQGIGSSPLSHWIKK